jgi:predicted protein tyrosine phosphatase
LAIPAPFVSGLCIPEQTAKITHVSAATAAIRRGLYGSAASSQRTGESTCLPAILLTTGSYRGQPATEKAVRPTLPIDPRPATAQSVVTMGRGAHSNQTIPGVCVCSRARAIRILRGQVQSPPITTMISIGDPGQPPPFGHRGPRRLLTLEFYDTIVPSDPFGPTEEDVESVLAFAPTVQELGGTCLVHCQAGISRSTATSILLYASWFGPGREGAAAKVVQELVPHAIPNPLIITYGDNCLGCRGALQSAVDATFSQPAS